MDTELLLERMALSFEGDRPSILSLVRDAVARPGDSAGLDLHLPDEAVEQEDEERGIVRFAAGALDALIGGPDRTVKQTKARTLVAALTRLLRHPSSEAFSAFHQQLKRGRTNAVVDEVLRRIAAELPQRRGHLAVVARRLIQEAPDVESVKMGVALLGVSGTPSDEALVREIGQSDEFTLYSVVALGNLLDDSEDAMWRLARSVHGWGRIAVVERLANTRQPAIKDWLLRDGFRNSIMFEYLAHIAATTGELLAAVSVADVDDGLLSSIAEVLGALINGGPAPGINDYGDAAPACAEFLRHALLRENPSLAVVSTVSALGRLSNDNRAEQLRTLPGWSAQTLLDIRARAAAFMQMPGARTTVLAGLNSDEMWGDHFVAAQLAPLFGIDPWPFHFSRQRRGIGENWWHLMQTDAATRVGEVLALAREQLDLTRVGSGPTRSLGLGVGYKDDRAVDFIVQELRRFPGLGADFVEIGLRGRSVRLRHMAVNALRDWGRERWPAGAQDWVVGALAIEPEQKVRERLELLLANKLAD